MLTREEFHRLRTLIAQAIEGEDWAHKLLYECAERLISDGNALPPILFHYVAEHPKDCCPKKHGAKKGQHRTEYHLQFFNSVLYEGLEESGFDAWARAQTPCIKLESMRKNLLRESGAHTISELFESVKRIPEVVRILDESAPGWCNFEKSRDK